MVFYQQKVMMKLFSILALIPASLMAQSPIYYSDQLCHVELRSTNPSLLLFESPVISVSCQPALVEFENLSQQSMPVDEQNQIKVRTLREQNKDEGLLLKRMIRVKPLREEGTCRCAIILSNGDEVNVEFLLKQTVTTPMIEFKPFAAIESIGGPAVELRVLTSLLRGDPIGFLENRDDHKVSSCKNSDQKYKNYSFETSLADYKVVYFGKNQFMSALIIEARIKDKVPFKKAATFNSNRGAVNFSLTTPQSHHYQKGVIIRHHVIARSTITKEELRELVP